MVVVKVSKEMPIPSQVSRMDWWNSATTSAGVRPSSSARTVIGVPWVSEPETMATRLPRMRW